jgi:hypothetical protein
MTNSSTVPGEGHTKGLRVTRNVTRSDCPWLDRDIAENEVVYPFHGHTYGCIGPGGIAVAETPDGHPFFELPATAVEARP